MSRTTGHDHELTIEARRDGHLVRLDGDIDLSNVGAIRQRVMSEVPPTGPGVVVDLTSTTYLDSSGVRLLFELAGSIAERGQRLVLVVAEAALVRRVVVLTKVEDSVPIVATVDEAFAELKTSASFPLLRQREHGVIADS